MIQGAMTAEEFRGFLKGNIVKYISRADYKNGVEDLEKARWYLDKLTEAHNRAVDDTPYGMPLISLRDEED
ncbi:hypothetical protein IV56_GL001923 [Lacticaseibacillus saniviri JCM 17471 = DSM 24301]|uniref:DUF3310 domain-containing protein n=1 Tax=Lacticaseibacillus saniviri JCM 17471 = DSM 24301 TaxID=1293598 RepID=A0A0R2MWG0_9LACO|nr:hypothetical protein IV56_GL001923 [Lacticaseibacillus saniviri JCM 17471 = DSM 24301]